jgi:sirohydrochlorin cobaltochelatase
MKRRLMAQHVVVLVGHGAVPADAPRRLVVELKRLEGERRASGEPEAGPRERELDRELREWPRTPANDPYRQGLESIATALAPLVAPSRLTVAYNEFCAPSVEEAFDEAVAAGATRVTLLTTMVTPGGSHAEDEIPALIGWARRRHPSIIVDYAWPYDPREVAAFFAAHLGRHMSP